MSRARVALGRRGEGIVACALHRRGMIVVERNFRTRRGEIDLIALAGDTLVFVEVKTRRSLRYGAPQEAITPWKSMRIRAAAEEFLLRSGRLDRPCRFDAASVLLSRDNRVEDLHYIENAF